MAAVALAACGRGDARRDPVADAVAKGVKAQLGIAPRRVRCQRDRCDIELPDGLELEARLSGDREVTWESESVVVVAPIAAYVRAELVALGVEASIDCGPALIPAKLVPRITCTIDRGPGQAWVDVLPDGGLRLELVLEGEAVEARTEPVDTAGLDGLSRALDTDVAQGVDESEPAPDAGSEAAQ